ncbi:MAG: hypothetical protein ACJ8AS_10855 [Hyphomicrobiales bacterium]
MKAWSLGLAVLCSIGAPLSAEQSWDHYRDTVHGCSLEYPASVFRREPLDVSQDAQRFSSADQSTSFRVLGFQNEKELTSADIKAKYFAASVPGSVVYDQRKSNFWVASGFRGPNIFYMKVALSPDRRTACVLEIVYPRSKKTAFDHIVTRMSRSFGARP